MRIAVWIAFVLPLFAQDPGRGVNFYTYEKEVALGRQLVGEYLKTATVIESPELLARIEEMAHKLIPAGSRYTYTFALVEDQDLVRNEPVSMPGGFIFVPSGLILNSPDSAEVARMLAHAIAHVEARHGSKAATKDQIVNHAYTPLIFTGGWTGYAVHRNASEAFPKAFQEMRVRAEAQADELAGQYLAAATGPFLPIENLREMLLRDRSVRPKEPPRLAR